MRIVCLSEDHHGSHEFVLSNRAAIESGGRFHDQPAVPLFLELRRSVLLNPNAVTAGIEQYEVRQVVWVPNGILQSDHSTKRVSDDRPSLYSEMLPDRISVRGEVVPVHCRQLGLRGSAVAPVVIEDQPIAACQWKQGQQRRMVGTWASVHQKHGESAALST